MKYVRLLAIVVSIISILSVAYIIFQPYLYNENTVGKDISAATLLNKLSYVVNKKYEVILYENCENLKGIYWNNSYKNINKLENSNYVYKIRRDFDSVIMDKLQQKSKDTYIVYYREKYVGDVEVSRKMIIKYNQDKERAVILYDSSFGVNENE